MEMSAYFQRHLHFFMYIFLEFPKILFQKVRNKSLGNSSAVSDSKGAESGGF